MLVCIEVRAPAQRWGSIGFILVEIRFYNMPDDRRYWRERHYVNSVYAVRSTTGGLLRGCHNTPEDAAKVLDLYLANDEAVIRKRNKAVARAASSGQQWADAEETSEGTWLFLEGKSAQDFTALPESARVLRSALDRE